ncbi:unnamed protein product [Rotaria sp. Silwood1]|nr:unnamed protein product [Rotaria sp. Silwood1]CAF4874801.1 unnamed protein product [Rotaria sp. Silwood1]CAF4904452.1 unnamed protein product [Rotaria sp. Silwood1]CAF4930053.1 unnamed protein product [Rotaria sp. Silwood1]
MSMENNSSLKIMTLGRPFKLGMLYDFRTDKLIPNISLWNSDLFPEYVHHQPLSWRRSELYLSDKFTEKADLLGIDNNMKLSVLADLVDLSGSAYLINDQKTTNRILRFILKYSFTKNLHEITMAGINKMYDKHQKILHQQNATHLVTGILYGREIIFIFDRTLSNDADRINIENSIKLLLKKFDKFKILSNGELDWENHEKQLAKTLTCQYYGDFQYESTPTTFEEAFKFYIHSLKFVLKNNDCGIPKQALIYPIYLLNPSHLAEKKCYQINDDILTKSLEAFDNLHRLKITLNDFKNNLSSIQMFYRTKQQMSTYITRIFDIDSQMRNQMTKLLPKIRDGSLKEIDLTNLLDNLHLSSSNTQRVDEWIQLQTEEINELYNFQKNFEKQNNIRLLTCSFVEVQKDFTSKFILRLIFHVTEKNDSSSKEILQYFDDKIKNSANQYTKNNYWYNENNIKTMKKQILSFIRFAELNSSKSNIEFIVNEEYADEFQMKKGITCILYQNGVPIDFEIPSEPGRPFAINISDRSLTLCWSKPTDGSQNIQQYKIYSKNSSDKTWTLLLITENATISVNISDLTNGKYQFKIQGVTLVGDTAESDASDKIYIKALPQPIVTVPAKIISKPAPNVASNIITDKEASIDVTPAWFEPVKLPPREKIRFPANYNKNSPDDVRTYDCLSTYRSMVKKTDTIDFVAQPFSSAVNNTETLVVVLNELAHILGARLTFSGANYKYNDSDYRTACGVTNLGSIHSFLASDGNFLTAKFDLHLDLNYKDITQSPEALRNFVLTLISDISSIAECDKDFIRVFSVKPSSSALVEVEETRGGLPYYFPQGWYRHALKVIDKYPDDKAWLGMNNGPGEWAVAYHGTKADAVKDIKNKGLLHELVRVDLMKDEAKLQNPSIPDVKGLYVATHCERGAARYTHLFAVKDDSGETKNYRVVFQCRVQPGKFTVHSSPVNDGMAWRVFDEKAIRPYGLLLKKT